MSGGPSLALETHLTTLPNGIRVVTAPMPHAAGVTLGLWVAAGGRHEPAARSGISHFVEHMLFKGTPTRSAAAISRAIEGRGGYFDACTQEENTCYFARVPGAQLWHTFDVLCDMFRHASFDRAEVERERDVIVEEILMYRDEPPHVVQEELSRQLWPAHSLGRPVSGEPETVRALRRTDLLAWKTRTYCGCNTVVAFAGQVEHAACVERVARTLGGLPRGRRPTQRAADTRQPPAPLTLLERPIEQAHLALGVRIFGRHDARRYALRLLNVLLGENMSSRLFQVVRERHGLAYAIQSTVQLFDETGVLVISAGIDRQRRAKALALILRELARFRERPVSPRDLRMARDYAIGQLELGLESTTNRMNWIGEHLLAYDRIVMPDEIVDALRRVTVADMAALAQDALRPGRLALAVMVPERAPGEEASLRRALVNL